MGALVKKKQNGKNGIDFSEVLKALGKGKWIILAVTVIAAAAAVVISKKTGISISAVLAGIAAFVLSCAAVIIYYLVKDQVRSAEELTAVYHLPVIGTISVSAPGMKASAAADEEEEDEVDEEEE